AGDRVAALEHAAIGSRSRLTANQQRHLEHGEFLLLCLFWRAGSSVLPRNNPLLKRLQLAGVGCAARTTGNRVSGARSAPYEPESSKQYF
ncbi:hypothetical protein, partial [Pseudomonas sp.]|uniref:hypothetical protein n=1 Tax=Pseudomonas sp. TaxID=306 RepID=UPI002FC98677